MAAQKHILSMEPTFTRIESKLDSGFAVCYLINVVEHFPINIVSATERQN